MNDKILQEDIEILSQKCNWSELYNSSILITGATGLIGQYFVFLLLYLNENENANIRIFAFVRNENKAKAMFGGRAKISFVIGNILESIKIIEEIDYIIHGASITQSHSFVDNPVETIDTAYKGMHNILEFACKKQLKSIVYLSSMEVFGITDPQLLEVRENDYGYIDILNPRSSYSESKRLCECLCASYSIEYSIPVKIARLTQTLGPGVDYDDTRLAAFFARSVIKQKDIILQTEGKPCRPCLYIRDAISGIFTVLLKGENGTAYTIANKNTAIPVYQIAEMVAEKIAENKIKVKYNITNPKEYAFNQDLNLFLNTDKIESLGWQAEIGLEEAYKRMIESMKYRMSSK
ncbi:MAG: NAD(P)-dependent oxidoreductase [Prevotella sp.]|nr:NAD(P)-dependent oxidoreductase [Prevotella sp.]